MTRRRVRPPANFLVPDQPFQTRGDLDVYIGGDTIQCLLCGLSFLKLARHLTSKHAITVDDYKVRFGIPFKYGLSSRDARAASSERMKTQIAEGQLRKPETKVQPLWLRDPSKVRRARATFLHQEDSQKLVKLRGRPQWTPWHYEEFLRRVAGGRTASSVGEDADLPNRTAFMKYIVKNEDLRQKFEAVLANHPIHLKVRSRRVDADWQQKVLAMRAQGMTWAEISQNTGITATSLMNMNWYMKRKRTEAAAKNAAQSES